MTRLRMPFPSVLTLALPLVLLAAVACTDAPPDAQTDGGETGPVLCASNDDCPADAPTCSGGVCTAESTGCTSDADCASGSCNQLTGECAACEDCCTSDADCSNGQTCGTSGHCEGGAPCTTADECDPGQICDGGTCQAFDPDVGCTADTCPRDHQCNPGSAMCEGCLNDAFCQSSAFGPKCDTTDDGVGPGPGYCYFECGADVNRDCADGFTCSDGLCVASCQDNSACENGLACVRGSCGACEADNNCDPGQLCNGGLCVDNPGCDDAQCQTNLGGAYYCDSAANQCRLGCTDASCGTADGKDCNPCPDGGACNATTHQCEGGTNNCDPAQCDQCAAMGMVCDSNTCQCTIPGGGTGGTGTGQVGEACMTDKDCADGLGCSGAIELLGMPGTCGEVCSGGLLGCMCADPSKSCSLTMCITFGSAPCE